MKNFHDELQDLNSSLENLWSRAYRDSLTNLFNRAALENTLLDCLDKVSNDDQYPFALFYMDLNGFKKVNDTLGHDAGDLLLKAVASDLKSFHDDEAFRLGGDEFVVVVPNCRTSDQAMQKANQVCSALSKLYEMNNRKVSVAPSIGVVFCDRKLNASHNNAASPQDILNKGDETMYQAKMLSKTSLFMQPIKGVATPQGRCLLFGSQMPADFEPADLKPVLRNGIGVGRLTINDEVQNCDFRFIQYPDGEMRLDCRINSFKDSKVWHNLTAINTDIKARFEGTVDTIQNGLKCVISCNELHAFRSTTKSGSTENFADVAFYLSDAHLDFRKDLISSVRFYLINLRLPEISFGRDKLLHLRLDQFHITVGAISDHEDHQKTVKALEVTGGVSVTCWAQIDAPPNVQIENIVRDFDTICTLLTSVLDFIMLII